MGKEGRKVKLKKRDLKRKRLTRAGTGGAAGSKKARRLRGGSIASASARNLASTDPGTEERDRPQEIVLAGSDLELTAVEAAFFATAPPDSIPPEPDPADPRRLAIMSDAAVARRAYFTKYVASAVAVSLALCAAALIKAAVIRKDDGERSRSAPSLAATKQTDNASLARNGPADTQLSQLGLEG